MSVETGKVCCNCRHCIRRQYGKYGIVVSHCEINKIYLSYADHMTGWCRHWAKEKSESRKLANIGVLVAEGLKRGIQEGE